MKRTLVLLLLPLAACESASGPDADQPDLRLSEQTLWQQLNTLAADSMWGREAGSEYERQAADYVRGEFVEYGLEPGAQDYFQTFPLLVIGVSAGAGIEGQEVSQNVLGVLPGEGALAGQWVIVGAHYDHIGWKEVAPDSIVVFNGADDNASGTALLMEMARVLTREVERIPLGAEGRRSIMFQAYGAEEAGLIGSTYFCQVPTVPMDSIVAMLNFDMVGRLRDNELILIGSSSSTGWADIVAEANVESLLITYSETSINRSDQRCFYEWGRPVLFFHTGLHAQYHTAHDDVELINRDGMLSVGEVGLAVLLDVATRADRLEFTGDVPFEAAVVAATEESGSRASPR
jgi:Zn-dependent M28 family amino/carboxypeptidase